jgi:hypothetical protein
VFLESAGLEMIASQVDLEGPPFVVNGDLVHALEAYGRVTYNHEALGVFLNTLKESIGIADENQNVLDEVLRKYDLMTPIKTPDTPVSWRQDVNEKDLLEKIVGENTLRPISFLQRALIMSRAVALVDVGEWLGTGFMVSPSLLLTNHHILSNQDVLKKTVFRFNFQLTFDGKEERVDEYRPKENGLFHTSKSLDFTVVELNGTPGHQWAIAPLDARGARKGRRVNIIQHPGGLPKQISFQNNIVRYVDGNVAQYVTTTLGGSSGSPVFDDSWRVVALHHAGGMLEEPATGQQYFRNEGIQIGAIINSLPGEIRAALNEAA